MTAACSMATLMSEIGGVLWGIDITPAEILLADRLRERGRRIDAVIGHHPRGRAQAQFPEVMHIMEYMMEDQGVPITVAEDILGPRIKEVARGISPNNIDQAVDAARLLDVPVMCLHSCTDNLVQRFLENYLREERPERVADILAALLELPEYDRAARNNSYPEVLVGDKGRRAGKVMVKMTGGTSMPKDVYENLAKAGVGTVVCMHVPENHIEEARKNHVNIVISGHMPSDSLGVNLLADRVEEKGVEIVPCSGFIRVRRTLTARGSGPRIFKDQAKLSFDYVPEKLVHREAQMARLVEPVPPGGGELHVPDGPPDRERRYRQDRHHQAVLHGPGEGGPGHKGRSWTSSS